jgi:hypothetical protein
MRSDAGTIIKTEMGSSTFENAGMHSKEAAGISIGGG